MELFKPGLVIDFMRYRYLLGAASFLACAAGLLVLFVPGPNYGIDFKGGTEIEMAFTGKVGPAELRGAIADLGYDRPDVVNVEGRENQYIIRVLEVSSLSEDHVSKIRSSLQASVKGIKIEQIKVSPGGDKVSLKLGGAADPGLIQQALQQAGARVRVVSTFGQEKDYRYEARLIGVADTLIQRLRDRLGDRVPASALRVEWVGPKAGAKLRDSAVKSILYAVAFIMVYVAFRFDLRFAPGGVIALVHDVLVTILVLVLLGKEVSLATVAALLTVIGFSINDTIVIYDRVRENMQKMRDTSMYQLINISTSQTLSRTIITSGTALLSIAPFFFWGTAIIRDLVFTLFVGFLSGIYSTVYIATPLTEWIDRRFFGKS